MSHYNHSRFGREFNPLGKGPLGLPLRTLLVVLVGGALAALALTADLDIVLKAPLTAIPVAITLAFIAMHPNKLSLDEFLANWLRFEQHPKVWVFKGHREDERAHVQVDPAGAVAGAAPMRVPVSAGALVHVSAVERLTLAGVLIGFWLVAFTSVALIMLMREHVGS